jgi:hypothetical protein
MFSKLAEKIADFLLLQRKIPNRAQIVPLFALRRERDHLGFQYSTLDIRSAWPAKNKKRTRGASALLHGKVLLWPRRSGQDRQVESGPALHQEVEHGEVRSDPTVCSVPVQPEEH